MRFASRRPGSAGVVAVAATVRVCVQGFRPAGPSAGCAGDARYRRVDASMTKAMTATAAMQLIEQGKIKLGNRRAGFQNSSPPVLEGFQASKPRCDMPRVR